MNKGLMMNLGYLFATVKGNYQCMVFHDVDMVPIDDRNLYKCEDQPIHLSAFVNNQSYVTLLLAIYKWYYILFCVLKHVTYK